MKHLGRISVAYLMWKLWASEGNVSYLPSETAVHVHMLYDMQNTSVILCLHPYLSMPGHPSAMWQVCMCIVNLHNLCYANLHNLTRNKYLTEDLHVFLPILWSSDKPSTLWINTSNLMFGLTWNFKKELLNLFNSFVSLTQTHDQHWNITQN